MVQHVTPYSLISSYSIEAVFLGVNCVLYAFCAYTLWGQKSMSCRLLLFINTAQFLLCTAQITLHTISLFLLFTVVTDVSAWIQRVNVYIVGSTIIYNTNFIVTGLLSIWRLYVLYDYYLTVCIPPFVFWIAQICASVISIRICATTSVVHTHFTAANLLLWAFIAAVNLCVAIPICVRFCLAQKKTNKFLSRSPYTSMAIIFVECGTLITVCSVGMVILYVQNYAYALISLGLATEVAIASQLLITARHAMLSQSCNITVAVPTPIEISLKAAKSRHDMSPMNTKSQSLSSFSPESTLQGNKSWASSRLDDDVL